MKTTLLLISLFLLGCAQKENPKKYTEFTKCAIVKFTDNTIDTVCTSVTCEETPSFSLVIRRTHAYLIIQKDLSAFDIVAVNVKSFKEIKPCKN